MLRSLCLSCIAFAIAVAHAQELPRLGVDAQRISVSGLSSGGYMAVQLGIAHSVTFSGVGVFAGGPYGCAETGSGVDTNVRRALGPCMAGGYGFAWGTCFWMPWFCPGGDKPDAKASAKLARKMAADGHIDPLSNVGRQRIYLLSGEKDVTVVPAVVDELAAFYHELSPQAQVKKVSRANEAHTFPTLSFAGGNACGVSASPFVSDCDYDGARHVLEQVYGPLTAPAPGAATAPAATFDQHPYFPAGATKHGLAAMGYVYVPEACKSAGAACALHVALHGCRQDVPTIGRAFVDGAGFNRWAEANRIVVLYPQVEPTAASGVNPRGCWDWWGYTGTGWADRRGAQPRAILAMVSRLRASP